METQAGKFDMTVVERLPALPAVLLDLMSSLQKEGASLSELATKIGKDIPLSLRVLKVVNSPFYGLPRQIGSLPEAVMVLGAGTVKSLVTAALFTQRLPLKACGAFDPRAVWEHGLVCALCARRLAPRVGVDGDVAFTAGLLHDIGLIVLYGNGPGIFEQICRQGSEGGPGFLAAERSYFGLDHAVVGGKVAARWHLPTAIEQAVAGHHEPPPGADRLVDLLHIADALCRFVEAEAQGMPEPVEPDPAYVRLGVTRAECLQLIDSIASEFAAVRALLEP